MAWVKPGDITTTGPWKNENVDTLLDALDAAFGDLNGSNFSASTTITMEADLVGGLQVWNFAKWFGASAGRVIDSTAYDFGKTGNTAAQNQTALQNAIDALPDTGGVVMIPPGEYDVNAPVYLRGTGGSQEHVTVQGFGRSTVLDIGSGSSTNGMFRLGGAGTALAGHTVRDLRIEIGSTVGAGCVVHYATNPTIQNVFFVEGDSSYDPIYVLEDDVKNLRIDGCEFVDCDGDGITIYTNSVASRVQGASITRCLFDSCDGNPIHVFDADGLRIMDCVFKDCCASRSYANIWVETYVGGGVGVNPNIISGNIITGGLGYGIVIRHDVGSPEYVRGINVSENLVLGNAGAGIMLIRDPGTSDDVCRIAGIPIHSNIVMDQTGVDGFGILLEGHPGASSTGDSGRLVPITSNIVARCALSGIAIYSPDNTHGTGGDVTRKNAIVGNVSSDDQGDGATQDYGINVDVYSTNTGWIYDHVVIANIVRGNVLVQFNDEGTDTSYGHNSGY